MKTLQLALNGVYFDQIKAGTKAFEYRLRTPYWEKRMAKSLQFNRVVLTRGYPPAGDLSRRLELPWRGYTTINLQHEHFGPEPVEVFAILVGVL